jgi:hypothetical protein
MFCGSEIAGSLKLSANFKGGSRRFQFEWQQLAHTVLNGDLT